jgi:hypothetical protein
MIFAGGANCKERKIENRLRGAFPFPVVGPPHAPRVIACDRRKKAVEDGPLRSPRRAERLRQPRHELEFEQSLLTGMMTPLQATNGKPTTPPDRKPPKVISPSDPST